MDSCLTRFVDRLRREDVNMHGFLLTAEGEELAKVYYAPFEEGQPHRLYSISKTMTGLAVGLLAEEGKLTLDDPICAYFADWLLEPPHPWLAALTLRDMLRMATCYRWTTYREGVDENWARTFFEATPTHAPGTVFNYDTGCSQVLAALVRRVSGQEVIDFLNERLFQPLDAMDKKYWLRDPSGCCQGGTGLCMSLRDLHRVALCLLNGGEGLIPAWYASAMGEKHIETLLCNNEEERYGYGWQCWRTRAGWAMYGLGGQLSMICPEKNAVLSTIADTRLDPVGVQRIYDAFFEEVYPHLGAEIIPPLQATLAVQPLPDFGGETAHTGDCFIFEQGNPLRLRTLRLSGEAMHYENDRGEVTLPLRRGKVIQVAYPGWPEVPALVSAGWVNRDLLRVRCFAVGHAPCGFDMLMSFAGDTVTVQSKKSHDPVTEGYDGVATGLRHG